MRTLTEVDYLRTDQLSPGVVTVDGLVLSTEPDGDELRVTYFGDIVYYNADVIHAVIGRIDAATIGIIGITLRASRPVEDEAVPAFHVPKPSEVFPAHKEL